MIRSALQGIIRHRSNITSAVIGQLLGIAGIAIGTRILTEHASTATFGEAKLLIGMVTFVIGLLIRPFIQFIMRAYHDAISDGSEGPFQTFARRSLVLLASVTAILLAAGLSVFRLSVGRSFLIIPLAVGGMLIFQSFVDLERGILITRNLQGWTSLLVIGQHWGLPLGTALALTMVTDSAAVFVTAQATICLLLGLAARTVAAGLSGRGDQTEPGREQARSWTIEARAFITPLLGIGIFQWIVSIGDRYILAGYTDMSEVGKYAAVYGLISAPFLALSTLLSRILYPFYYSSAAKQNLIQLRRLRLATVGGTTALAALAVLLVVLLGEPVSNLLLAEQYRAGVRPVLGWLALGYGLLTVSFAFETNAFATKKTYKMTVAYGVAAAVNIGANLILIPEYGILGAAQATCVTFAVYLLILAWFDFRKKPVRDLGQGVQN